jgi:LPPG:FO 2-phospho-L-lactate transferase
MAELGIAITNTAIATHYRAVLNGLLLDERDPPADPGVTFATADTLMHTLEDRIRVARAALVLAEQISKSRPQ